MKKILLLLILFISLKGFAQYPVPQKLGGDSTELFFNGALKGKHVNGAFIDTASANLSRISQYPYAQIAVGDELWLRNGTATQWLRIGSGGTSGIDTVYVADDLYVLIDSTGHQVIHRLHNDGLVSGGIVTSAGGFNLDVSSPLYYLNGVQYVVPSTTVTIAAADPTNPRKDIVIVDSFGVISVITGTAASSPIEPQPNPASQIKLTVIDVPAGATALNIITEFVYQEGTEWDTAHAGTMIENYRNTDNPHLGTYAIFVNTYTDGSSLILTDSGPDTTVSGEVFKMFLYLNGALGSNHFQIQFWNGATSVSGLLDINPYLNPLDSNEYQNVSILFSSLGIGPGVIFDKIILTMAGNDISGAKGYYIDDIQLQSGITNIPPGIPNLQQVTDVGNVTTNFIEVNGVLSHSDVSAYKNDGLTQASLGWRNNTGVLIVSNTDAAIAFIKGTSLLPPVSAANSVYNFELPSPPLVSDVADYVLPVTVNGQAADPAGNITIAAGGTVLTGPGYVKMSAGAPTYLTPTQVTADLNPFTSSLQGLVPASGGSARMVLHGDGTWKDTTAATGGTLTNITATAPITITGTSTINPNVVADTSKSPGRLATYNDVRAKQDSLNWYMPEQFGTVGTADDASIFQLMFNTIPAGSFVYLSSKTYNINTQVNINKSVTILGAGQTITRLVTSSATINMFRINAHYVTWNDLSIVNIASGHASAGAGIYDSLGQHHSYTNIKIDSFYNDLVVSQSSVLKITNCKFHYFINYGLLLQNVINVDSGDQSIIGTDFYGSATVNPAAGIRWESGGGLKIVNCKFSTASASFRPVIHFDVNIGAGTSDLLVSNNSFESYSTSAIKIRTASPTFRNIAITGNQFYGATGTVTSDIDIQDAVNIAITGNVFTAFATYTAIALNTNDRVTLLNTYNGYTTPVTTTAVTYLTDMSNMYARTNGRLNVYNFDVLMGADSGTITRTASTNQYLRFLVPTYAGGSFTPFNAQGTATNNLLFHGGGNIASNAVTKQYFYTAPALGTSPGTVRMIIDSSGNIGMGTAVPGTQLDINSAASNTAKISTTLASGFSQLVAGPNDGTIPTAHLFAYGASAASTTFGINRANSIMLAADGSALANFIIGTSSGGTFVPVTIGTNNVARLTFGAAGLTTWSTSYQVLAAGTATAGTAPLRFTAGTVLTSAVSGAHETDASNDLYYTNSTAVRARVGMWGITSTAIDRTATNGDYTILVTVTGKTVTLPTAVGINGRVYVIKLTVSGTGTVATTSSQTIDGSTTYSLSAQYKYITVQSDNANWNVIANN